MLMFVNRGRGGLPENLFLGEFWAKQLTELNIYASFFEQYLHLELCLFTAFSDSTSSIKVFALSYIGISYYLTFQVVIFYRIHCATWHFTDRPD